MPTMKLASKEIVIRVYARRVKATKQMGSSEGKPFRMPMTMEIMKVPSAMTVRKLTLSAIVKKAGFTQGAFYGYYPSKEALFEALAGPAADNLIDQFKAAQDAHFDLIPDDRAAESRSLSTKYLLHFVNYVYDNFDAFKLVLCCSDDTRFSSYVHDLVELDANQTERYYGRLREQGKSKTRSTMTCTT